MCPVVGGGPASPPKSHPGKPNSTGNVAFPMTSSGKAREGGKCQLRHFALCIAADSPQLRGEQSPAAQWPRLLRDVKEPTQNVHLPLCLILDCQGTQQGPETYIWAGNGSTHQHTYRPSSSGPCSNTSPCSPASHSKAATLHMCQAQENFQCKCSACTGSGRAEKCLQQLKAK